MSAELNDVEDALEAARCPQCRRHSARPLFHGVVGGFGAALWVFVHLLGVAPRPWWGHWLFVMGGGIWAIGVAWSFVYTWRRRREVVFAAPLPTATARFAAKRSQTS